MKKIIFINGREVLSLVVIFISWLLIIVAKKGSLVFIEPLPLPIALFWMGTGIFLTPFLFKRLMRIEESLWRGGGKGIPLICCLLIAYQLHFFSEIPLAKENTPYFFIWVLPLFWVTSVLFYGKQRGLLHFRLLLLALLTLIFIKGDGVIPIIASLFLVVGGLMAFKRREGLLALCLQGAALQVIIAGGASFFYWNGEGSIEIYAIYAALGGGVVLGLVILLFLHAFIHLRTQVALIGMSLSLVANLTLAKEEVLVGLFCLPLLFVAAITLRYIMAQGKDREVPQPRPTILEG